MAARAAACWGRHLASGRLPSHSRVVLLLLGCPPHSTGAAEPAPEYLDYHSDTPWRPWGRPQVGPKAPALLVSSIQVRPGHRRGRLHRPHASMLVGPSGKGRARPPQGVAPFRAAPHITSRRRPGAHDERLSEGGGGAPQLLPRRKSCRFHHAGMCWHCCSASGFCGKDAGDGLWCGEGNQPAYSYAKIDPSSNLCGKRPMPITSWVTRTSGTAFRQPISMPHPRGP